MNCSQICTGDKTCDESMRIVTITFFFIVVLVGGGAVVVCVCVKREGESE